MSQQPAQSGSDPLPEQTSRADRRRRQRTAGASAQAAATPSAPVVPAAAPTEPFRSAGFWALVLGSRVCIAVVLAVAFYAFAHDQNLWNRWFSGPASVDDVRTAFTNWDAQHYLKLARDGFAQADEQGRAFFPVLPLLIAGIQVVVRDWTLAGLLVTLVCTLLAMRWFVQIARARFPLADAATFAAMACVLAYPTAFFLHVVYTEAVFCAALLAYLRGVQANRGPMRWAAAFLLPLCRPQGILLAIAVVITALVKFVRGDRKGAVHLAVDAACFALGAALYLGFCWSVYGSPFAGIEAQKVFVFGNELANAFDPMRFVNFLSNSSPTWFAYKDGGIDKLFAFVMLAGTFLVVRLRDPLWTCMYLAVIWLPASMGSGGAFCRYAFLGAPFLALAALEIYRNRPRILWGIAGVLGIAQVLLAGRFAVNLWVG